MSTGRVDRVWPNATIVCLGNGPSLTQSDVNACRGRARMIAIKDAVRLAPWADVLYFSGSDTGSWWKRNQTSIQSFPGLKFTLDPKAAELATVLKNTGELGLETEPTGLRTGRHSGYAAINLAVHLGASRIVLLGYDLAANAKGHRYWFGPEHPYHTVKSPYEVFLRLFPTIIRPLAALSVELVNCSRETALTCVPRMALEEALPAEVPA